jgi:exosortase
MATTAKSSSGEARSATPAGLAAWLFLILVWLPLLVRLARQWSSETEQLFGFGVPVLVGWLLWQRRGEWLTPRLPARGAAGPAVAGALFLGAATLALEANPLWPTAAWLGVTGGLLLTLAMTARGHGWRGARAAAPVWVLMLTSLKWPALIYVPVMQTLMQVNALIATELVNLTGTLAVVQGNVIEVARGMVGVDEACSGLRSLQTVIMMALFLGEADRLRPMRRLALAAGAVFAALLVNVVRTTLLTWIFANLGAETEERWHDSAGMAALLVTLLLVWMISERLRRGESVKTVKAVDGQPSAPAWRPWMMALACVALIETGTQAWYGWHERGATEHRVVWELSAPEGSGWGAVEVPPRTAEMLRYESSDAFGREVPAPSRQLLAFAFRWSGDLARSGTPEMHDPLVCLPSVGAVEEARLPEASVTVDGVQVNFRFIRFRQGAVLQHVWFCLWSTRTGRRDESRLITNDVARMRLARVMDGVRDDQREQLIFFVQGSPDDESAAKVLQDAVLTLLRRQSFVRP